MQRQGEQIKVASIDRTEMNDRGKKITAMLVALEDEDSLTDWEKDFVASVTDTFIGKSINLTSKQYSRLETIYQKFN